MANILRSTTGLRKKTELFFLNLNLFPSVPTAVNGHELRNQKISTRLFIFVLTISLCVLLLYTSLINITQTVSVKSPSIEEYSQLYNLYDQTLTCDCTQISINYERFINIQYAFHQVCSSDFVTQNWIDYLAALPGSSGTFYDHFRVTGTFAFQALNTLCFLVNQTISNSLIEFYSTQYVSASVTSSNVFQSQIEVFTSQFISTTTNDFLLSLSMIRNTTQSNALLSGQLTNYRLYTDLTNNMLSLWYGDCTCASSARCIYQYTVVNYPLFTEVFPLPGFYLGCYIIEALLRSSLQCFYDQTCINQLQSYLGSSTILNVTALDISLSVQFFENSTMEDLLDQLMVEEWNTSSIYNNYYSECQPKQCSYTFTTKNSVIYISTSLIGLLGGLITVLKLITPSLVNFISRYIYKEPTTEIGKI